MKIKVTQVFVDENGLHLVGEVCEVSEHAFDPDRMEIVEEKKDVRKGKTGTKDKR